MAELIWLVVFEPFFHCLHSVFVLLHPTRNSAVLLLKLWIASVLGVIAASVIGIAATIWMQLSWWLVVVLFAVGYLASHFLAGLNESLDAEIQSLSATEKCR